jgi:hypothetical protein
MYTLGIERYFTKINVLKGISEIVKPFLKGLTFVDFSCGKNDFAPLLGCPYIAYDICPAPDAQECDWFKVTDLPGSIAIGLNPPFGYQGQLARKFMEHALQFEPVYMFLILPNMRWKPPNYEEIYTKELPDDSFYDPNNGKTFREISTTFRIFKRSMTTKSVDDPLPSKEDIPGVLITRKFMPKRYPFVILRRVGRNTTKQFYCVTGSGDNDCNYISNGKVSQGITWRKSHNDHAVKSEYFLKVYLDTDHKGCVY